MSLFTIKQIFKDNWSSFLAIYPVRPVVRREIERMLECGDFSKGYTKYSCPNCGRYHLVPFRCHSRFCNTCSSAYQQDRSATIAAKLVKCRHRHVVFTIPEELREYFRQDRSLLHILFHTAADVLLRWFHSLNKKELFEPGIVAGLHTFGRDLKWNPHIHILVSEGAIGNITKWKKFNFFPFSLLRKSWMTGLLKNMLDNLNPKIFNIRQFKNLVNMLYRTYKDGFYVNAPATKFNDPQAVANYITRYIARPAMAQSRITAYDGSSVTFWYIDHATNEKTIVTLPAYKFIKKLIIHIPERSFNMLRYYGIYAKPNLVSEHLIKFLSKEQYSHYKRVLRKWRTRILLAFNRSPLICTCGATMVFSEIYLPGSLSKRPPPILKYT